MALLPQGQGFAQNHEHAASEHLGKVAFSTSCDKTVQPQFNRAVALMHSFQFAHAIEAFNVILVTDPSCATAYWGIALSSWGNPFAAGLKSQAQLDKGLKAIESAAGRDVRRLSESAPTLMPSHISIPTQPGYGSAFAYPGV